jgi:hypothetical protein
MKVAQVVLQGLVIVFLLQVEVIAQQMTPNYEMYVNYSIDENDVISKTVVVDGTTVGSCTTTYTYICGPNNQTCTRTETSQACLNAVHTPTISNFIDSQGSTATGPAVPGFSYLSFQTTTEVAGQVDGEYNADSTASVFCSVAGQLYRSGLTDLLSIRETYYGPKAITTPGGGCVYTSLACINSQPTCTSALFSAMVVSPTTISCPDYAVGHYLVVGGAACIVGVGRPASGPGICN